MSEDQFREYLDYRFNQLEQGFKAMKDEVHQFRAEMSQVSQIANSAAKDASHIEKENERQDADIDNLWNAFRKCQTGREGRLMTERGELKDKIREEVKTGMIMNRLWIALNTLAIAGAIIGYFLKSTIEKRLP